MPFDDNEVPGFPAFVGIHIHDGVNTWNPWDGTLEASDIEIGAVEIKDGTTDARAVVDAAGELSVVQRGETDIIAGAVTVGAAEVLLAVGVATLANRRILRVYNNSAAIIYVGPTGVLTTSGYPILPNGSEVFYGAVNLYGIAAGAGNNVRVVESA
ncbi:MAG: hypothetical protein M0R06_25250 [Sphaerochaeta sp.]|jgi:hypothetical protein|nr:hypothetical protein [Sphaerochaeta sp.]